MTVRQAIQLTIYTTRSLKRDETAGYIRLVAATAEGDPDTCMCDAECDERESDRSPMDSDTDVNETLGPVVLHLASPNGSRKPRNGTAQHTETQGKMFQ